MMDRYPALKPTEITDPIQRQVYDETSETCSALFGPKYLYKDDNDAFAGPFAPILYTPSLMKPYVSLAVELGKIKEVPPAARETAILATGSVFQASFELYAHTRLALGREVLTARQIESIKQGQLPTGTDTLSEHCEVAFKAAIELATGRGPLRNETFEKLVCTFGRIGALGVIHYVGVYAYTCILLNGVAAPVPTSTSSSYTA